MKIFSEENLLADEDACELSLAEDAQAADAKGSLSLRRAYYFSKAGKVLLSAEQQQKLTSLIRVEDPGMKQKILAELLRKVADLAKRYINRGLELFELIREGNQGLIEALEKIGSPGGPRFSIHATWYICQSIERAIRRQGGQAGMCQPA